MTNSLPDLPSPWVAVWISPVEDDPSAAERPAFVLERSFTITEPAEAYLHVSALGVYEVFLNGQRVGDQELTPGSTSYDETLYGQTYDVTTTLRSGENRLEILLSDGWYRGCNGAFQHRDIWGDATAALAQLDLVGTEGVHTVVATDEQWRSRRSEIVRADLMRGQKTDRLAPIDDPRPVRVGIVDPPAPTRSPAPPVRRVEFLPASVSTLSEGVSIIDVGQNISGWVRLDDVGPEGSITVLTYGEHLDPDGDLTTRHLDAQSPTTGEVVEFHQVDEIVAGTEPVPFEPRHTVHGFRYVRVEHPGRTLRAGSVTGVVVHTDLRRTGWFECDDDRLNRLHETAVWSFRGNAVDVPTDCPTRERLGWTGDFQIFAPTAALFFDIDGFTRKWLHAVRDDQYDNGSLAMFSPDCERMKIRPDNPQRIGGGSAGWGDAAVAVPWTLYEHYGDEEVLRQNWPVMQSWVEFALGAARAHRHPARVARHAEPMPHEDFVWDGPFHFGEWSEPPDPEAVHGADDMADAYQNLLSADQGEVGTAFLYRSTRQLAEIAEVLGRHEDASHYRTMAELAHAAWRTEFLSADGQTARDTQASYVRALDFGLVPPELVPAATARLVELIERAGGHLATGFLSTAALLPVLADTGHLDLAYRLLTQRGVPSWSEMLARGATTFWENWDAVDEAGHVNPGSLNHYAKGAAMRFLHTHVAGLRQAPGSTGWREVVVSPHPGGEVRTASSRLESPRGTITVSWALVDDELVVTTDLPDGVRGTLDIAPDGPQQLSAGQTTVRMPWRDRGPLPQPSGTR